jgi:hypothetical protein
MSSLTVSTEIEAVFDTTLERAFKSPMLCDVRKVHTGHWITPRVLRCTDDSTWGQVGGSRIIHMDGSTFTRPGTSLDTVLARDENRYWKIEISDFEMFAFGFERFQGEWFTHQQPDGRVHIRYRYTMFSGSPLLYPIHWLFTRLLWRMYMRQVLENIRQLTLQEEPYLSN